MACSSWTSPAWRPQRCRSVAAAAVVVVVMSLVSSQSQQQHHHHPLSQLDPEARQLGARLALWPSWCPPHTCYGWMWWLQQLHDERRNTHCQWLHLQTLAMKHAHMLTRSCSSCCSSQRQLLAFLANHAFRLDCCAEMLDLQQHVQWQNLCCTIAFI